MASLAYWMDFVCTLKLWAAVLLSFGINTSSMAENLLRRIIADVSESHWEDAHAYVQERDKDNNRMRSFQDEIIAKLRARFADLLCANFTLLPASSFSAGLHLLGSSDMDVAFLLGNNIYRTFLTDQNAFDEILTDMGFVFVEVRRDHHVYSLVRDGMEIELKVRDKDAFDNDQGPAHKWLEDPSILSDNDRKIITWMKFSLQSNKPMYNLLKWLIYWAARTWVN